MGVGNMEGEYELPLEGGLVVLPLAVFPLKCVQF